MEKTTTGFGLTKLNFGKSKLSSRKFFNLIFSVVLVINVGAVGLAGLSLYESYHAHINHTKNNAQNLSLILEKNVESTLNRTNLILADVANQTVQSMQYPNGIEQLNRFLVKQREYLIDVNNLTIIDNNEQAIYKFNNQFYPALLEKTDFYNKTKKAKPHELIISEPVQLGNEKAWKIILSKKIEISGQFYGVVYTVLPIDNLNTLFQSISIGKGGSIVVRNRDFKLITHFPKDEFYQYETNQLPSKTFMSAVEKNLSAHTYVGASPVDNIERIYSFKKIGNYPLYINVGLSPDDILVEWKSEVYKLTIILAFFIFVSIGGGIFIFNSWRTISKNDEKLQLILNSTGEALYGCDKFGICTFCNKACIEILGYNSEEDLLGQNIHALLHHTHEDGTHFPIHECTIHHSIGKQISPLVDTEVFWRKDGVAIPVEYQSYPQIVNGSVVGAVVTFTDITERKKINNIIWRQANYDTLTELPNRHQFQQCLEQEMHVSLTKEQEFALLFIDLDHFKDVNDSMGHHTGDVLLQEVAQRLRNCIRKSDTVARLGGDEFTIILSNMTNQNEIDTIAENIIASLDAPFILNSTQITISGSIGITRYPKDATTVEGLLKNADQAMYVAKDAGRNCYHYFSIEMEMKLKKRMETYHDLREAISKNQFQFYLQPVIDLETNKITKAEALLRWIHPEKGFIGPGDFIPVAEQMGLIEEIGKWVFKASTTWLAQWLKNTNYQYPLQLSINMSPLQLENPHIVTEWEEHLKSIGLPPHHVVIEITEGLLLENNVSNNGKITAFREMGIQISIDDFGTGYSAMSYLYKYNIDFIKIDRSFVNNMKDGVKNKTIIEALILMAHRLGIKVVAEGIETEEQKLILAQSDCDYGQGYLLCRPIPPAEFVKLTNFSTRPLCITT